MPSCHLQPFVELQTPLPSPLKLVKLSAAEKKAKKKAGTEWTHFPLWPGRDRLSNIGYQQCLGDVRRQMLRLKIRSKSATHIYRKVAARRIDDQGADEAVRPSFPLCPKTTTYAHDLHIHELYSFLHQIWSVIQHSTSCLCLPPLLSFVAALGLQVLVKGVYIVYCTSNATCGVQILARKGNWVSGSPMHSAYTRAIDVRGLLLCQVRGATHFTDNTTQHRR